MKKYVMLFTVSVFGFSAGVSYAQNADKHIQLLQNTFAEEFATMDADNNGKISKEEYINYQFKGIRESLTTEPHAVSERQSVAVLADLSKPQTADDMEVKLPQAKLSQPKDEMESLSDVTKTLQEMADFDISLELEETEDWDEKPLADVEKMISEDESISEGFKKFKAQNKPEEPSNPFAEFGFDDPKEVESALAELGIKAEKIKEAKEYKADSHDDAIEKALDVLRSSLPKKIDDATTWTDIQYKNNAVAYIYQADIDTVSYSADERQNLKNSIQKEACAKAYVDLCPKMKTAFMDEGIKVRIRYLDKQSQEIGTCEFNQETCK